MGILNIRKAERTGSKLVIGIAGQSGSGKTLSALYMARGMVDHAGEIGFIDTENRRGSLYSNELDAPFLIGDLYYPFTPERYKVAIKEFQDAGVKVLVIDSISHEWESGCMEIAEAPLVAGKKMADWKKAKAEHKKLMTVLLQSDMHIICCIRAAEKMDFKNPSKPISLGIQPLCEKNFMFEMTASIMMFNEGTYQQHLKIPKDLKEIFGDGNGYIGQDVGAKIRQWVDGGGHDQELNSWQNKLQLATNEGSEMLKQIWLSMPNDIQTKLSGRKREFWSTALAVDAQMKSEMPESNTQDEPQAQVVEASQGNSFNPNAIDKSIAVDESNKVVNNIELDNTNNEDVTSEVIEDNAEPKESVENKNTENSTQEPEFDPENF